MKAPSSNLIETKSLKISFSSCKIYPEKLSEKNSLVELYKSGDSYYFGKKVVALKEAFYYGIIQTKKSFEANFTLQIKQGTREDAALSRKEESVANSISSALSSLLVEAKPCDCTSNTYPNPKPTWFINPAARPNLLEDDFHAGYQDLLAKRGLRHQGNTEYERGWYTALGCFDGRSKKGMVFSNCNYVQGYLIGAGLSNVPDFANKDASSQQYLYQVGGCLTPLTPTYVSRDSDRALIEELSLGEYCFVVASRQMGKTSLANRVLHRFRKQGKICIYLDLTILGDCDNSANWYRGFIGLLGEELSRFQKVEFEKFSEYFDYFLPLQKVGMFFDNIISEFREQEIVIFLDEIDVLVGSKPSLTEFLGFIRSCYNKRGYVSDYRRLTFCLLGIEHPSRLVKNNRTPFNIGKSIRLKPFQLYECEPMLEGLNTRASNSQLLLEKILAWTGGQPFLTQKVCNLIYNSPIFIAPGEEGTFVEKIVREKIINNWQLKDSPAHLETIYNCLLVPQLSSTKQLLLLYKKTLETGKVMVNNSAAQRELLRSGLVVQKDGYLQVFNRIYQEVFHLDWIETIISEIVTGDLLTIINSH